MLVVRRQEPRAGGLAAAAAPLAAIVELADHAGHTHAFLPVVELLLDLVFDDLALFFDDQDFFQPIGKAARALRLKRPGKRHLVNAKADVARYALVDAEIGERAHHVAVRLARSNDAEPRARRIPD